MRGKVGSKLDIFSVISIYHDGGVKDLPLAMNPLIRVSSEHVSLCVFYLTRSQGVGEILSIYTNNRTLILELPLTYTQAKRSINSGNAHIVCYFNNFCQAQPQLGLLGSDSFWHERVAFQRSSFGRRRLDGRLLAMM